MKKSLFTIIIAFIFAFVALVPAAHAGNVQRQRWEGIAIGIGAAIIGSAILNQKRAGNYDRHDQIIYRPAPSRGDIPTGYSHRESDPEYRQYPSHDNRPHSPNYRRPGHTRGDHGRGHWKVRKEWVPPTYKKVWNPGHYNRRGKWKTGHWITMEDRPGYWTKTRIWVSRR
jgi:hypothetical protein